MQALICPRCGAPLQVNLTACPYCQVGLVDTPQPQAAPPPGPNNRMAPVPAGWALHHDPWHGFTLSHPPGWEVVSLNRQVDVRADPIGYTSASLSPFTLPAPASAPQVAGQFIHLLRSFIPSLEAWQQGNATPDSNRITIKTRANRFGQTLEGIFNILVEGRSCMVSGYQAPVAEITRLGPTLSQILATFRTAALMDRQPIVEPREQAFSAQIPAGWSATAAVDRNTLGGKGVLRFSAKRDPQGLMSANMPSNTWNYMDGMGALGGWSGFFTGGYEALPYQSAAQYCAHRLVPELTRKLRGLRTERILERPDWAELGQIELLQAGYPGGSFDSSSALLEITYEENGVRLRHKLRLAGMRMNGGAALWNVFNDIDYRAPEAEFAAWEPILSGILGDLNINPQWKLGEQQLSQNFIANSQADIARRTQQISQTLSETSDLISSSYWNRQASYDRISEQRSNVMLGYQNMTTDSGTEYKLPTGFDRYWVDGLGNFYGGSWLTQPDVTWKPLEPTGI